MVKCTKCNENKDDSCYSFRNKKTGKLNSVCKECQKSYKIKYYNHNRQSHYDRNNKTKEMLKLFITEIKQSGCTICKETCIPCLEFHHLDPKEKDKDVSSLYLFGSKKRLKEEIDKCVLLCACCHRKVHAGIIVL